MEQGGVHRESVLLGVDAAGASIAGLAARVSGLAAELLAAAAGRLTVLVRDGAGDGAPGAAALEALAAAGEASHAADAVAAVAFARVEQCSAHVDDGVRDAWSWAQIQAGLSKQQATVSRRVARCLSRYPVLAEAFLTGRLRVWHLDAVDSIIPSGFAGAALAAAVELIASIQGELLAAAEACGRERAFRRFCARVRDRLDVDGPAPAEPAGSWLRLRERADGNWSVNGELSADDGAVWATLVEDRVHRDLAAAAVAEEQAESAGRRRSPEERTASALSGLLVDGAGAGRSGRVGLFLHVDLADLEVRGARVPDRAVHTEANLDLSLDTLRGLLAGADVTPVIADSGVPLCFGRTRRLAPEVLKRVLAHRDRTCVAPQCDRPPIWHDRHHDDEWADGGGTDAWNVHGLCRFHHTLHHEGRLRLAPDPGGGPATATRPDGSTVDPTPRWQATMRRHDPYRARVLDRLAADLDAARTERAARSG